MTAAVSDLLAAFDALSPEEQQEVTAAILFRTTPPQELPEAALTEMAAELCRGYVAEEPVPVPPDA